MSALPNPAPNQREDIVTQFRRDYAAHLADAQVSAEHTATEGWRRLWTAREVASRERRRELAKELRGYTETLEDFGWTEEAEKAVREIVKESAALRADSDAFSAAVVRPIEACVVTCDACRENFVLRAEREEAAAPLHALGLAETMRMAVAGVRRPRWNAEHGTVEIDEPTGEA